MPCCLPLARAASSGSIAICLEWLNWNIFLKFLCSVPSWKMPEYCFSFLGFSLNCWSIQSFFLLLVFQPSLFQTGWHTGSNLCELNIVICSPAAACQALKWQQFLSKKITKIKVSCNVAVWIYSELLDHLHALLWLVQKPMTTAFIGLDICGVLLPFLSMYAPSDTSFCSFSCSCSHLMLATRMTKHWR